MEAARPEMTRVIRGDSHNSPQFAFADFETLADAARERARAQAQELLRSADAKARREAEQVRRQARQIGIDEGRKQGMEAIRREAWDSVLAESRGRLNELVNTLGAAITQLETGKRRLIAESETGVIRLAVEIARRVCKRLSLRDCDVAKANAEKLIELVRHHHDAQLRVHPDDLREIGVVSPAWVDLMKQQRHVAVVADETVSRGGCVLASSAGRVDADIETQIDRITAALLGDNGEAASAATDVVQ